MRAINSSKMIMKGHRSSKPATPMKPPAKKKLPATPSSTKEVKAAVKIQRWFKALQKRWNRQHSFDLSKVRPLTGNALKSTNLANENLIPNNFEELGLYLDSVSTNMNEMIENVSTEIALDSATNTTELETTLTNFRGKLSKQRKEIQELHDTIDALKAQIETEKNVQKDMAKHEAEALKIQKDEMEGVLERQLNFIDQLVKDKTELTETCAQLKTKLVEEEAKSAKKLKELEKKHKLELKKNKEAWMAAEKIRKEKWEKEKTQEIKALTNKALEGEFVAMSRKHQQQLHDLHERLTFEFAQEKSRMLREFEGKLKQANEKTENDEREKNKFEELQKMYETQKAYIVEECTKEIEQTKISHEQAIEDLKLEFNAKIGSMRLFYETQIEALKK